MEEQRLDDLPAHTLDGLLDTASDFQHLITSFHATLGEARERIDQLEVALLHQLFPAFRSQLAQSTRTVRRLEHDHRTARTNWEEERHSLLQELSLVRSELKEARAGSETSKDDACEAQEQLTDVRQRKLKPDSDPLSRPILVEIDRQVPRGVTRRQGRDVASNYIAQEKENLGRSLKSKEEKPQGLLKDSDQLKLSYRELHRKYKNLQSQYNSLQQLLWGRTSNLLGSSVYEGRSPKTPGTTITVLPQALVTAPEPDNPEVVHDLASAGDRIPTSRSQTRKSGGIATNASVHIEVGVGSRSLKTTDMKENVMPSRNSASSVARIMADGVQIRMSEAGPQQPALEVVTAIPLSGWTRDKPTILGIPKPEEQNCMVQEPGQEEATSGNDTMLANVSGKQLQAPAYKYVDSVRKKRDREGLQATECLQCKKFYDAVLMEDANTLMESRCKHHDVSRHRYRHLPPATPENFWNIGFDSEL